MEGVATKPIGNIIGLLEVFLLIFLLPPTTHHNHTIPQHKRPNPGTPSLNTEPKPSESPRPGFKATYWLCLFLFTSGCTEMLTILFTKTFKSNHSSRYSKEESFKERLFLTFCEEVESDKVFFPQQLHSKTL